MKTTALLGGALGALVGACIWAAVSWATHLEIGWVAWGVGCLVGAGAVAMGGRGKQAAAVCALLAAVGIFGGKVFAIKVTLAEGFDESSLPMLSQESYEHMKKDAAEFVDLPSSRHGEFMVTKGYGTMKADAADLSPAELEAFRRDIAPILEGLQRERWTHETWKKELSKLISQRALEESSVVGLAFGSLSVIDVVFFLLGVSTAYRIVASRPEQPDPLRPATS